MAELPSLPGDPLFAVTGSVLAYLLGRKLYERAGNRAWLHPILSAACMLALTIHLGGLAFTRYFEAAWLLHFMLGPATVALAVPLYRQLHLIRPMLGRISLTVAAGGSVACVTAVGIAWLLGADDTALRSIAPKSVTTPIAIGISEKLGGLPSLSAGLVVLTGVLAAIIGPPLLTRCGIRDPRATGFALGLAGHGVATARAFEDGETCGAFSSLALSLTGLFTAITLPLVYLLFS